MINILQIAKKSGNYPLLNEMVKLDPQKFRTTVCYLGGKNDGKNEMDSLAASTYYLDCKSGHIRWYNFPLLRRIKKIIEENDIHIVNCHLHRTKPVGVAASVFAGNNPLVLATTHGLGSGRSFRRKLQNRLLHKKIHRVVCVSEAVKRDFLQDNPALDEKNVITIQNGLNFDKFHPASDRMAARSGLFPGIEAGFWFGTAGRLSPVKNQATLIRAFRKVVDRSPDCILLFSGQGELEPDLKELVESLGLRKKVHFLGFRTDVPDILRTLDAFVLPSWREGLPLAMLEAMATGLPVIASDAGGIPEVFYERPMGFMIDPRDVDDLAKRMLEMTGFPAGKMASWGENARERALRDFSAARMTRDYQRLFEDCYNYWKQDRGA